MYVSLAVKNNGIYPRAGKSLERQQELRARTALAYAYQQGYIIPVSEDVDDGKVTILARDRAQTMTPQEVGLLMKLSHNEGFILTTTEVHLASQPFYHILSTKKETKVEPLLDEYFAVPYRWLAEHPSSEKVLDEVFK